MSNDIKNYMRLANRLEKNPVDHNLSRVKETADDWSILKGIDYVVVKNGGWQVWAKSIADKCSREYVYSTSVSVGGVANEM
jgi:hypothetical protein